MAQWSKSNLLGPNIEKALLYDLFIDKFNDLIAFCDENTQIFLAKLWFQNLLAAKLSFQDFNVLTLFVSSLRVKRGNTMLPVVAKL